LISKTNADFGQGRDMTTKQFEIVANKLPFIRRFEFVGLGEPFLHAGLLEMVSRLSHNGKITCVSTNGTVLRENTCNEVIESGLGYLRISIDSADPQTFAKLREGAKLEEVAAGVRRLVEAKRRTESQTPKLILSVVASRDNQEELKDIIELAHSLGVPAVRIRNLYAPLPNLRERKIPDAQNLKLVRELQHFGRSLQITVRTFTEECLRDLRGIYVTVDGHVTPCIFAYYPEKMQFGNLFTQDFNSIWNSREYREFRRTFPKQRPLFCQLCKGIAADSEL